MNALLIALVLVPAVARADLSPIIELTAGPSWRVAFGQDARAPGFDAVTGGADLATGIEIGNTVGVLAGGRIRAGRASGESYLEASGDLAAQLRVGDRLRLRLGVNAGRAWLADGNSPLVGGFAAFAIDLFSFARGRLAATLVIRLDGDAFTAADPRFPDGSIALCGSLGGRY